MDYFNRTIGLVDGWTNPSEKIWVKMGSSSPNRDEHQKIFVSPSPRYYIEPNHWSSGDIASSWVFPGLVRTTWDRAARYRFSNRFPKNSKAQYVQVGCAWHHLVGWVPHGVGETSWWKTQPELVKLDPILQVWTWKNMSETLTPPFFVAGFKTSIMVGTIYW